MTQVIDPVRLEQILSFLQSAEALKDTLRSARTSGGRQESTAEHSWRLCLLVLMFEGSLQDIDVLKLLKLCILHDLGEAISGDTPAIQQRADDNKVERERADLIILCNRLPDDMRTQLVELWDEYAAARTPEAILAKGFDKIETMLQHLVGRNGPDFDYAFNLSYGVRQTDAHPLLRQIRTTVDAQTAQRIKSE